MCLDTVVYLLNEIVNKSIVLMKIKAFLFAALLMAGVSAFAQEAESAPATKGPFITNEFGDNWFIGLGAGLYGDMDKPVTAAGYIPLGIGFKWKFAERCGLNIAWQHNIYWADDLEAQKDLNDRFHMNGWNWMNCDLTGMMTIGIVFEFARAPKACRTCYY